MLFLRAFGSKCGGLEAKATPYATRARCFRVHFLFGTRLMIAKDATLAERHPRNISFSRSQLGICLLALILSTCTQARDFEDRKPNILFILADDQRTDTLGVAGNLVINTPHLDSLARRGLRFERAYGMGSMNPAVCIPSRAMINSGRSLFRIKDDLEGIPILPEQLRQAGYMTFGTGKWHNQTDSFLRGFEQGRAVFFGGMSDHTRIPITDIDDGHLRQQHLGEKFSSTLFADEAIQFLESYNFSRPFYAYVAFTAPHDPRQAPEGYIDMYDPEGIPLPTNYLPQHPFFNGWMTGRDEQLAAWPRSPDVIRSQLAEYYGLISHMDFEIGRLLAALEKTGEADNTIVVFAADHGLALGSHGLLGKQNLYEHSTRAPLLFVGKDIPEGESSNALVYLMDIFPTLAELAGVDSPGPVDGRSLVPIMRGRETEVRDSVYTAFGDVIRAVRDPRWKLIRYPHINRTQLFDLESDPQEMNDLSADAGQAGRIESLMALLSQWQQQLDDPLPLTTRTPQAGEIDLTGHPRKPDRHQPAWIVEKYF